MILVETVELSRAQSLDVATAIRALTRTWQIPQGDLALRLGLHKNALARLSTTTTTMGKLASIALLDAVAAAYGTDRAGLLAGRGAPVDAYAPVPGEGAPSRGVPRYVLFSALEAEAIRKLFVELLRQHREVGKVATRLGIGVETVINLREARKGSRVNELVLDRMATALVTTQADLLAGKAGPTP